MRHGVLTDDGQLASTLVPSFTVSVEQVSAVSFCSVRTDILLAKASRLDMGIPVNTLTWLAGCIILQTMIESFVLTIVMEEHANIGLMEEHLSPLQEILRPFCASSLDSV